MSQMPPAGSDDGWQAPRSASGLWLTHLATGFVVACVVMSISVVSAMNQLGNSSAEFERVKKDFRYLLRTAEYLHEQNKAWPDSFRQVEIEIQKIYGDDATVFVRDPWGRPYRYSHSDDQAWFETFGRDGQPGGPGLDGDLSTTDIESPAIRLTLWQFLTHPKSRSAVGVSALSGLFVGVMVVLELRRHHRRGDWLRSIVLIALWTVLSLMAAGPLAIIHHIPSNH